MKGLIDKVFPFEINLNDFSINCKYGRTRCWGVIDLEAHFLYLTVYRKPGIFNREENSRITIRGWTCT